jgi:hypothetical protein
MQKHIFSYSEGSGWRIRNCSQRRFVIEVSTIPLNLDHIKILVNSRFSIFLIHEPMLKGARISVFKPSEISTPSI